MDRPANHDRAQGPDARTPADLPRTCRTHQAHDDEGRGVTYAYLRGITSGHEHPSRRSLELIAASLDLEPDYFPEYRLARLRAELDPKRAGFAAAWRRYLELAR
ncbi:MAG: hypothetical protein ACLP8S_14965 [Solirubrobacteraceae bacterium]